VPGFLAAIVPCPIPTSLLKAINQPIFVHFSHKKLLWKGFSMYLSMAQVAFRNRLEFKWYSGSRGLRALVHVTCPRARGVYGIVF
jgi:hypothetical protein